MASQPTPGKSPATETAWRLFDLRHKDLQSISKAQKVHLTTVLILMSLFWIWSVSRANQVTLQGFLVSPAAVWLGMPGVLTFFSLALVGSINAASPAKHKLFTAARVLDLESEMGCDVSFYDLDTDKNVLDYLSFLKVSAADNRFGAAARHSVAHFLYPTVLILSCITTACALWHLAPTAWMRLYSMACISLQFTYFRRLLCRSIRRFRGHDPDN